MCFPFDALPPVPPIHGAAVDSDDVVLTSKDGSQFAAFVARAASDLLEIVRFASWLGWGALAAVFALVANSIVLAVQARLVPRPGSAARR